MTRPAGARNSSFGSVAASHWRFVTSKRASSPLESVRRDQTPGNSAARRQLLHVAQESPEHMRVADAAHARGGHVDRVIAEIRHPQIAEQHAAIGVRVGAMRRFALGASSASSGFSRPVHRRVLRAG